MARSSSFTPSFSEPQFRDAVLNTMLMGLPEDPAERLTWYWNRQRTYASADPAANPYNWSSPAITDDPGNPALPDDGVDQSLQVPYALEFSARPAGAATTVLGEIDTSRALITIMDTDWAQVRSADYARIAGTRYRIQFDAPPQGLFGVTVYTVYLEAEDET